VVVHIAFTDAAVICNRITRYARCASLIDQY